MRTETQTERPRVVAFTPEQQERIDAIVETRLARTRREHAREISRLLETHAHELRALKMQTESHRGVVARLLSWSNRRDS